MRNPNPIFPDRTRNIRQCTFGWVDHNFLHHGHLNRLSQEELLLYYFLITVADRHGVSFYDYERICQLLKLELDNYLSARNRLCERSLIAYQNDIFQVLPLPEEQFAQQTPTSHSKRVATEEFQTLKNVFQNLHRGI